MALTYGAAIQDQVASTLFQTPYTSLGTAQKFRIDGGAATNPPVSTSGAAYQAWARIQQWSQWSELLGSDVTSDAATPWLIAEIVYLASMTLRPERTAEFRDSRNAAREAYLDAIATIEIDDGYEAGVFDPTLKDIRFYVLRHLVKLEKPRFISPQTVDSAVHDRINWLWNKANWTFKRRKMSAVIGVVEVEGATWTESTKTLTETGSFTNYPYSGAGGTTNIAGAQFVARDGTNVVRGHYLVSSKTSADAIVLGQSLSKTAANLTAADIDGEVVSVNVFGLQSGDRLDAVGTRKLYIDGNSRREINWATADDLSFLAAASDRTTGTPERFRIERQTNTLVWHFWPVPDEDYTVHFDGMLMLPGTTTPGVPTSATDTTPFARFPHEFKPLIKDLALGKVLKDAGMGGEILAAAEAEVDRYAPQYDEPGRATGDGSIRDVYGDAYELSSGYGFDGSPQIGGPM